MIAARLSRKVASPGLGLPPPVSDLEPADQRYLHALRLNRARRELRLADPDVSRVSDVANRWNFWHMGQFAADYRRLFGELPW